MSNQNFYLKKRNGNCSDFLNFFSKRGSICFNSSIFFARDISNYILAGNFEENFVKIFAENVVSGNSVQIGPNFPAKSLSIYTKNFLITFLTNVIKENLRQNTLFDSLLNIAKQ